jgi:pyridoxine kinase
MNIKRVAAIHDLSGVGKCSLTVALPVLCAMGAEVCALPTAVLSTHTGGISGFTYRDLTDDLPRVVRHWASLGLKFDAVYTGFASSAEQLKAMRDALPSLRSTDTLMFIDPVMGDAGKLYKTYTPEMADATRELCAVADVITPNRTEAALLTRTDLTTGVRPEAEIRALCRKLSDLGQRRVALTGVETSGGRVGAAAWDAGTEEFVIHSAPIVEGAWHGTGDLFASVTLGALMLGRALPEAVGIATAFTHGCIARTKLNGTDPRFGVAFECALGELTALAASAKNHSA